MPQAFDWKPDESVLDFEAAPDPPNDYRCCLQWNHPGWDKSYGNHVLTREVRDDMVECHGIFPTFWAPELLDEQQFRKFCYCAQRYADEFPSDTPRNYLPHDWRDTPEKWEEIQQERREKRHAWRNNPMNPRLKALFELADSCESSEDEEDDSKMESEPDTKRPADVRMDWTKVKRVKAESTTKPPSEPPVGLLNLDNAARSRIAEYLDPVQCWYLRRTCTNTKDWPKPAPNIDYDFVYFAVGNGYQIQHGVAHTLNDVYQAVLALDLFQDEWEMQCKFEFVKFDRRQPLVPLLTFEDETDHYDTRVAVFSDIGKHYFGVRAALPLMPFENDNPGMGFTMWDTGIEGNEPILGYGLGNFLRWCDGLEPRERMNLEHIGTKILCCRRCGRNDWRCQCNHGEGPHDFGPGGDEGKTNVIYYSPKMFGGGQNRIRSSGPTDQETKSWIVFSENISVMYY